MKETLVKLQSDLNKAFTQYYAADKAKERAERSIETLSQKMALIQEMSGDGHESDQ